MSYRRFKRGGGFSLSSSSSSGRYEKQWRVGVYKELQEIQHKPPPRVSPLTSSSTESSPSLRSSGKKLVALTQTANHGGYGSDGSSNSSSNSSLFDDLLGKEHPTLLARMRSLPIASVSASWPQPDRNHLFYSEEEEEEKEPVIHMDLVAFTIECSRSIPLAYHIEPDAVPRFLATLPQRELYEHQKTGTLFITHLLHLRLGCILADEMRMGKCNTIGNSLFECIKYAVAHGEPRFSRPCLIVCPIGVVGVWVSEFLKLLGPGVLSIGVLTTDTQQQLPEPLVKNAFELQGLYDIIITTYPTIQQHYTNQKDHILYQLKYRTVVFDEAHELRNPKTQRYEAAIALQSETKICVSGTIYVNDESNVHAILRLIGIPDSPQLHTHEGLHAILRTCYLARKSKEKQKKPKKNTDENILSLTHDYSINYKTHEEVVRLPWVYPVEKHMYEYASDIVSKRYDPEDIAKKNGRTGRKALSEIHYLRQMCASPYLIEEELTSGRSGIPLYPGVVFYTAPPEPKPNDPPPPTKTPQELFEDLARRATSQFMQAQAMGGNVDQVQQRVRAELATLTDPAYFDQYWHALVQRINALRQCMVPPVCSKECWIGNYVKTRVEPAGEKVVIFSYWTKEIARLKHFFNERIKHHIPGARQVRVVSGKVKGSQRDAIWQEFQTNPDVAILLVSLQTGNVGIDLTAANHMIIMDLWWTSNPVEQAISRIKGGNQKRDIHIYYLVMSGTVDEGILEKAAKKMAGAKALLPAAVDVTLPLDDDGVMEEESQSLLLLPPAVEERNNTADVLRSMRKQAETRDELPVLVMKSPQASSVEEDEGDAMDIGYS